MFHARLSDGETQDYADLLDHNGLDGWAVTGSEWTATISEECLAVTQQPLETGKSGLTRSIVLLGVLTAIALLGAATWTQSPVASRIPQEHGNIASTQ
ncbi:MAG TPA: hypothetical protein V6D26_25785 [Stenomitos sp.]